MTAALDARDLYRFYHAGDDETLALRGVSLQVDGGEIVAITGPSGSGKSTLLACLAGLDEPDGGMVRIAGTPLSRRPEQERTRLRARSIGMLFQSVNLIQHLTVTANVLLAQRLAGKQDARRAEALLESVGLSARAHAYPPTLSGGESARAGLAVALANDPPVLLADEPTGEIDGETSRQVIGLLQRRAREGGAVVVVTHNEAVAAAAGRVVRLVDGRVAA
ncbi:ABC-type antimicrobial peptide transport system ATPase component [Gaiella occulta]|uniref:ABC-type antimicrobial peptide transport system ATPase component n=1 Tax=Gaiella occulta TaxID=1002870 RepID=A0A7M2Z198_9ACTN|nr:ABC transporter ATP-binding protein [Gaiella occulta]RDI76188.1 ABC-type antimicrobial peptide transport system ATPase component [Gaiella occulta]